MCLTLRIALKSSNKKGKQHAGWDLSVRRWELVGLRADGADCTSVVSPPLQASKSG